MIISKDMTIADLLTVNSGIAEILMSRGMHCVGCPAHSNETLEEACMTHGIDATDLITEINNFINK